MKKQTKLNKVQNLLYCMINAADEMQCAFPYCDEYDREIKMLVKNASYVIHDMPKEKYEKKT